MDKELEDSIKEIEILKQIKTFIENAQNAEYKFKDGEFIQGLEEYLTLCLEDKDRNIDFGNWKFPSDTPINFGEIFYEILKKQGKIKNTHKEIVIDRYIYFNGTKFH